MRIVEVDWRDSYRAFDLLRNAKRRGLVSSIAWRARGQLTRASLDFLIVQRCSWRIKAKPPPKRGGHFAGLPVHDVLANKTISVTTESRPRSAIAVAAPP